MSPKISHAVKEFTNSRVRKYPIITFLNTLKAMPPSLKINNSSGIEEWLTTDQEINMVHYVNEKN